MYLQLNEMLKEAICKIDGTMGSSASQVFGLRLQGLEVCK